MNQRERTLLIVLLGIGLQQLFSWLAANGPLKPGLTEEDATAIVWTMTSPEVHHLFRVVRGWPRHRAAGWRGRA